MIRTTPFHERLERAQRDHGRCTGHWSGYLSALKYDMSPKHEYFAVRNSAGFFDTSPLYKYRIAGRDAEKFLGGVDDARHPHLPAWQGAVHAVVRRPRLRARGRRGLPALRQRVPADRGRAEPRLPAATWSGGSR